MKTKHTPGPWRISENKLSVMANHTIVSHAKNNDDAKLIAAAPDLLEALQFCVNHIDKGHAHYIKAIQAIKKATE